MAEVEIAPPGTRALLREVATTLRGYEKEHRRKASVQHPGEAGEEERVRRVEKADRNARLAGRVEALLAGWDK